MNRFELMVAACLGDEREARRRLDAIEAGHVIDNDELMQKARATSRPERPHISTDELLAKARGYVPTPPSARSPHRNGKRPVVKPPRRRPSPKPYGTIGPVAEPMAVPPPNAEPVHADAQGFKAGYDALTKAYNDGDIDHDEMMKRYNALVAKHYPGS